MIENSKVMIQIEYERDGIRRASHEEINENVILKNKLEILKNNLEKSVIETFLCYSSRNERYSCIFWVFFQFIMKKDPLFPVYFEKFSSLFWKKNCRNGKYSSLQRKLFQFILENCRNKLEKRVIETFLCYSSRNERYSWVFWIFFQLISQKSLLFPVYFQ